MIKYSSWFNLILKSIIGLFGIQAVLSCENYKPNSHLVESKYNKVKTELYIGGRIENEELENYLEAILLDNFTGYTIIEAVGGWKNRYGRKLKGLPSRILVIFHSGSNDDNVKIEDVRLKLQRHYDHDAILQADFSCAYGF